ncbi:MAG: hypothetical protein E2P02_13850 [Acidobacteria bacterium]|nr:MAG: hypothetical protein E2P02_13850 [Acidobacteriota bacterium]
MMLKKFVVVFGVLLLVVGFLLMRDYDSPELGQALLDEVGDATGIDMTATGFRFNLFSGIELDNVTATSRSEGRSFDFSLDQLVFEHRIWPLLSGTVAIDRIVLDRPQFELVEASSSAGAEASAEVEVEVEVESESGSTEDAGGASMALEISQILVRDGTIVIKSADGSSETRVEGLDFTMENLTFDPTEESLAALSAEGKLTITRIVLDTITMSDLKSTFQLAGAVFDLTELTFATPHGNFGADARIDFNPVPFTYTMSAQGDPLDLNSMTGASEGFGPGTVRFEAEGSGASTKDIHATGELQLAAGTFPDIDMFSGVDKALGKPVLVGAAYEATEASFTLENNVIRLSPFRFTSEVARLDLSGTVSLEGPINLDFSVATPREGLEMQGVGGATLDVLADDDGWVPVPMTVSGTLEAAKVRPDSGALLAQAKQGVKREVKKAAGDALRGLFGRR